MKKHRTFCRGPSLVCMNRVFDRIGEYNEVIDALATTPASHDANDTGQTQSSVQKVIGI